MDTVFRGSERAFQGALNRLDERGCSLLVSGAVGTGAFAAVCRRLNGGEHLDRRRIHVALEGGRASAGDFLPGSVGPDNDGVRVLDRSNNRSATSVPSAAAGDPPALSSLEGQLRTAIADLEPSSGYEPGMLRVVVNSLEPLVATYGHDAVRRWVRVVASEVTDYTVRGRVAFVAPCGADDPLVRSFRDVFDARIEVRSRPSGPVHRWVVDPDLLDGRDEPFKTEWLALPA